MCEPERGITFCMLCVCAARRFLALRWHTNTMQVDVVVVVAAAVSSTCCVCVCLCHSDQRIHSLWAKAADKCWSNESASHKVHFYTHTHTPQPKALNRRGARLLCVFDPSTFCLSFRLLQATNALALSLSLSPHYLSFSLYLARRLASGSHQLYCFNRFA